MEHLPKIRQNHDRPVGSHPELVLQVFLQAPFCFGNSKPAKCQLFPLTNLQVAIYVHKYEIDFFSLST